MTHCCSGACTLKIVAGMIKKIKDRIRSKRITCIVMCCIAAALVFVHFFPREAEAAGIATDYLTISVGYYGMDATQYVTLAEWHWSELEEILGEPETANYTYYNESTGLDKGFTVIVSTATGYYLDDILNAADVNVNNVRAIHFFTQDFDETAFASFTYSDLFQNRYYYNDLLYYIKRTFNKNMSKLESWEITASAELNKEYVRPMLALESNWITYDGSQYTVGHSYALPEDGMSTSTRFRLEYGMTSAGDSGNQSTSAKYVYQIGIEFKSSPTVSGMPELDMSLGTHTVSFTIQAETNAEKQILEYVLNYSSSDETALTIDSIEYEDDSIYSNIVHVTMTYTVYKEGGADITIYTGDDISNTINGGTIQAPEVLSEETESVEEETEDDDTSDRTAGIAEGDGTGTGDGGDSSGDTPGDTSGEVSAGGTNDGTAVDDASGEISADSTDEETVASEDISSGSEQTVTETEDISGEASQGLDLTGETETVEISGQSIYVITKEIADLLELEELEEVEETNNIDVNMDNVTDSAVLPSAREELSWVWIGGGTLLLLLAGGAAEIIRYRRICRSKPEKHA